MIKGVLRDMTGWSQLLFFCFLSFAAYTAAVLVLFLLFDMQSVGDSASATRMAMVVQSVCLFLIPSLAFVFLCHENAKSYIGAESVFDKNSSMLLLGIVLIAVIQPFIYTVSYYNQQMALPESMSSIESWMREAELNAEKSLALLFAKKSVLGLILNLLVLAIVAGLAEEFFFRGCLQQIVEKISRNKHLAVWITAFIFSAMHFQFYGFIPRLLLGALLGYLFVWSRNIWIPVIVHTVHNAINVILTHVYIDKPEYQQIENFSFSDNILFILSSFVLSVFLFYFIYRKTVILKY